MKILIFYTPRSKSTMIHDMCCKKYGLTGLGDMVTKSRIMNKNFNEYEQLISTINNQDDICVKLNGNDFFDSTRGITDLYTTVDFQSFDKIIFLTRENLIDAVLSYGYMDPENFKSWHRKKGQVIDPKPYHIPTYKVNHLLNGYATYQTIKQYILSKVASTVVYEYEYDAVSDLVKNLDLSEDIDLIPTDIHYKDLVTNYDEVVSIIAAFGQSRG